MAIGRARRWIVPLVSLPAFALSALALAAVEARRVDFGTLQDGTQVAAAELSNGAGLSVRIIALGAAIQSLSVPDRRGVLADVVLGYDSPREYVAKPQYFGATVGRYANRIARGRFSSTAGNTRWRPTTDRITCTAACSGFDKVRVEDRIGRKRLAGERRAAPYRVPMAKAAIPGTLKVTATYLAERTQRVDDRLSRDHRPADDRQHHQSQLSSIWPARRRRSDVLGHRLTLFADAYTPVDATLIPTGERRKVAGRRSISVSRARSAAHSRRARRTDAHRPRLRPQLRGRRVEPGQLRPAARLEDPASGRVMELLTTAPACSSIPATFSTAPASARPAASIVRATGCAWSRRCFRMRRTVPTFPAARLDPGRDVRQHDGLALFGRLRS